MEPDIRPSDLLKAGEAPYVLSYFPNPNDVLRWDDTAGACVDPENDTAIWVAQAYSSAHSVTGVVNIFALSIGKLSFSSLQVPNLIGLKGLY